MEQEPEHRAYLERHLRDDGFDVVEAGWNAQALDLLERVSPAVVITAEPELCRRLRAGEPGRTWNRNVLVRGYPTCPMSVRLGGTCHPGRNLSN